MAARAEATATAARATAAGAAAASATAAGATAASATAAGATAAGAAAASARTAGATAASATAAGATAAGAAAASGTTVGEAAASATAAAAPTGVGAAAATMECSDVAVSATVGTGADLGLGGGGCHCANRDGGIGRAGGGGWRVGQEGSPTDLELLNLLESLRTGEMPLPSLPPYIHNVNVHSAAPEDLFKDHQPHAPGTGRGKDDTCYFYNPAPSRKSISNKGNQKRNRNVGGIGIWHPENCQRICGADGSVVGKKRRFSYHSMSRTGKVSTGWILFEVSSEKHEVGVNEMVMCTIHQSNYKKLPETSSSGAKTTSIEHGRDDAEEQDESRRVDELLGKPSDDISSPAQVRVTPMLDLDISPVASGWVREVANISTKFVTAAENLVSNDFKKVPEMDEFLIVKEVLLRIIDELRLDRSILTGSLEKLEIHRQYLVMAENLTPEERALLASLGAGMKDIIFSAYTNETAKKAQKAFNVLREISTDVQMIEQNWDPKGKHNVQLQRIHSVLHEAGFFCKFEGAESERPGPVNSSAGASSSGVKRKPKDDHPDAPPSTRHEPADKDREQLNEAEQMMLADDDEMPDGADVDTYQAGFFAGIQLNVDDYLVQAEQQGLTEAVDGGTRLHSEEAVDTLPAEGNPDEFLEISFEDELQGISFAHTPCPPPEFASYESASHVPEECQAVYCGICMVAAFDT